jgi:S1-C subfamily serine protease
VSRPGAPVLVRPRAIALFAVLALVAVLGRVATTGHAADPPASNRLELGVVAVEARVGGDVVHSSGTVIDADRGLVLTSARAVWGATSLKLATGLGILHGRIVARAPCDELALVETQPRVPGLVSLADRTGTSPTSGALVTAYGRRLAKPGGGMLTVPARVANAPLKLDALLVPEAAGGPILDAKGQLVGIAAPAGGTIPWDAIKTRLDELQPGPRRVYVGWKGQYDCAARLNRVTATMHPGFRPEDAIINAPVPISRVPGAAVGAG